MTGAGASTFLFDSTTKTMKTYVLLLLWLVLGIASHAQPVRPVLRAARDCLPPSTPLSAWCCESPDELGLLRVLAPELSAQCPRCTLITVAQCTLTEADLTAQNSRLRYTLRNPDGTVSTAPLSLSNGHITSMTLIPDACPPTPADKPGRWWHLALYPPGDPVPACGQPLP